MASEDEREELEAAEDDGIDTEGKTIVQLGEHDEISDEEHHPHHRDEDVEMDAPPPLAYGIDKGKAKQEPVEAHELDSLPWVEKYRPATLDDVVSHKDIVSTIDKFISLNRLPHLLFYGPPGTGKTSTILAVARKIYGGTGNSIRGGVSGKGKEGSSMRNNVLELNASDDRGIDVVRDQIKNFASTRMIFSSGYKLIILDEADMMTTTAQNALRRVIEQYTKNVRFCIICNYVNRIIPAVQSRCTRFRFGPLETTEVDRRIQHVVDAESVNLTQDGREALLKLSKGDMRRALNVLQACHSAYPVVDEGAIYACTGNPHPADIDEMVTSMMSDEFQTAYQRVVAIKTDKGLALQDIIAGLGEALSGLDMPPHARIYLLDHLAQIEHRLSTGGSEKLQMTALLGAFQNAVELSSREK
ncbi:uncharacterized protein L969DRAFT_52519 [Mixia osmundae IAM 14324]|uniref:Replication factor C subunit 3 n=1 Tax=Mixia osmundae (strain CBS 9802 / IAM 14324 / JCM 22182 / KY 12970) TaxID=764103 RepID=G7DVI6_MIXOS|nr:uncharacterized protein L969DRAFT_52519 [Mixia osmundae IAM 14324]KEI37704.1 hypothetical protein L969DRAFT_52519 [Mixia osmundae IAM 14324]GAA94596.1 hypothetical protein E5Q_01248 [Mixia osmundae IAM 14324]